ncbi:hypothetical protein DYH10_00560 [Candidatus Saccharibacteria bacterium CPR2]|nr:hypothetical protein [Candidatus Saccharibacteria bacterium CPR2]
MKRVAGIIAILVVLASVVIAPVYAIEENTEQESTTTKPTDTTLEDKKKEYEAKKAERLKELEAKAKAKTDAAKEKRIKAKCQAAQGILKGVSTSAENIKTNRKKIYERLTGKVEELLPGVKEAGIDTTKLEADIAQLKTLLNEVDANFDIYTEKLNSAVESSCQDNPSSFYELLETARNARASLIDSINKVKEFVINTIKPDLQEIKSQLEKQKQSSDQQTEQSTNTSGTVGG